MAEIEGRSADTGGTEPLYIRVRQATIWNTHDLGHGVNIDVDEDGKPVGVEFIGEWAMDDQATAWLREHLRSLEHKGSTNAGAIAEADEPERTDGSMCGEPHDHIVVSNSPAARSDKGRFAGEEQGDR
jgi:uncharacterized protein YuzE